MPSRVCTSEVTYNYTTPPGEEGRNSHSSKSKPSANLSSDGGGSRKAGTGRHQTQQHHWKDKYLTMTAKGSTSSEGGGSLGSSSVSGGGFGGGGGGTTSSNDNKGRRLSLQNCSSSSYHKSRRSSVSGTNPTTGSGTNGNGNGAPVPNGNGGGGASGSQANSLSTGQTSTEERHKELDVPIQSLYEIRTRLGKGVKKKFKKVCQLLKNSNEIDLNTFYLGIRYSLGSSGEGNRK